MFKVLIITRYSAVSGAGMAQTLVEFDNLEEAEVAVCQIEKQQTNSVHFSTHALRLYAEAK